MNETIALPNYYMRPAESLAIRAMLRRGNGAKVAILEGAPGTGKTALGEAFAVYLNAPVVYYQCHHWTTEEEMFLGVDVGRVAAGVADPSEAYRPGFLLRAVEASHDSPVVVIVDEIDKAPQRAEALLLDFLQHGRVHGLRGEVWQGNLSHMYVFITTNAMRPLMEATMRRGFRVSMTFLPANVEADILRKKTGAGTGAIRAVVRMANIIRTKGATSVSLQEMTNLLQDMTVAQSASEVQLLIAGWLCKEPEDMVALVAEFKTPHTVLWGEYQRG